MLATSQATFRLCPGKPARLDLVEPEDSEGRQVSERSAGWYPDPWTDGHYRYWTGEAWTADVFPEGVDPQGAPQTSWSRPGDAPTPPPTAPSPSPPVPPQWEPQAAAPAPDELTQEPWSPVGAVPTGRRRRGVVFMALMLLAGLVIGFVGVFGLQQLLDRRSTSGTPGSAAAAPSPPGQLPSADPAASVLPDLVVRQSDVDSAVTVAQLRNGTAVSGATTLDLCNGTFPSESLRTARLQVAAYDDQGTPELSTEAVAYRNAAATTQAFAELKEAAARCPNSPVRSPVGEPTVTTSFSRVPDSSWPRTAGVDRQAYHFTTTDATGTSSPAIAVYLKRRRIVLAVYFPQPDGRQGPVVGQSTVAGIVEVFQERLSRLPSSLTGG